MSIRPILAKQAEKNLDVWLEAGNEAGKKSDKTKNSIPIKTVLFEKILEVSSWPKNSE